MVGVGVNVLPHLIQIAYCTIQPAIFQTKAFLQLICDGDSAKEIQNNIIITYDCLYGTFSV